MPIDVDLREFEKAMKGLNAKMRSRKLMQIIRKVAGPAEKAAKQEVAMMEARAWAEEGRITTGNLEASIGRIKGKSKEFPNIQVAPRAKGKWQGFHGGLVHFGTKSRKTKSGFGRGSAKPDPYMERAFDKTRNGIRANFEKEVARYIEKNAQ